MVHRNVSYVFIGNVRVPQLKQRSFEALAEVGDAFDMQREPQHGLPVNNC